ncbi:MAG: D-alanine--D-alanine ligase [Kiritimatiellia bacterium]
MQKKYNTVAVLMGGSSSERDISMQSGKAVVGALCEAGYEALPIVLDEHDAFTLPPGVEAVFIALHGTFGEDGGAQSALRRLGVPYTGSDAASSRISFDKLLARAAFEAAGVRVPKGAVVRGDAIDGVTPPWLPVVVKPPCQGSSVGISIVKDATAFPAALAEAAKYGEEILLEAYIPGREWTVPIVGEEVLPIVEITPQIDDGWYDWTAKYASGGTTRYTFPEDDPANAEIAREVREQAMAAFKAVNARGVGRVDFRVSPEGVPYALELNSIPGCTATSILPKSAAKAGISFPALCARILESAQCT